LNGDQLGFVDAIFSSGPAAANSVNLRFRSIRWRLVPEGT
jgi:hypothetical protein